MKRLVLRALGLALAAAGLVLAGWIVFNLVAPTPAFEGVGGFSAAKDLVLGAALVEFGLGLFRRAGQGAPREARPVADREQVTLDQIRALVAEGRKIEAIKRYRDLTGAGLADAQHAVAELVRCAA